MKEKPRMMHLNEKVLYVPFKIYEERLGKCENCYAYREEERKCVIINEPITARARTKAGSCPMGFWSSHYGN
jgi:hypothetical protein